MKKKKITDVRNNMMVTQRRVETEAVSVIMKGLASLPVRLETEYQVVRL